MKILMGILQQIGHILWLPYKGCQNQIKVLREPHMKYNVTQIEGKNEPVNFSHSVLGNCFLELKPGNYQAEEANSESNEQFDLLQFSRTDNIDCNIVNLVFVSENRTSALEVENQFWLLYFDGSKTQEESGASCVLIDQEKNKHFLSCRLEFECTNNTAEYKALIHGLKKKLSLKLGI